jgi:hypothetical protein
MIKMFIQILKELLFMHKLKKEKIKSQIRDQKKLVKLLSFQKNIKRQ